MRAVARIRATDYTAAATQNIVSQWNSTGNQRGWRFYDDTAGKLGFLLSSDGIASTVDQLSAAPGFVDGTAYWVGVEYDTATGTLRFYQAADTDVLPTIWSGWTQLGTDIAATAAVAFNSTANLRIGAHGGGDNGMLAGTIYRVVLYDDGVAVANPDFTRTASPVAVPGSSFYTDSVGNNWTLEGTAVIAAWDHTVDLSQATETDSSFALTGTKTVTLGLSTETDSSFAVTLTKPATFGLSTETDSSFALAPSKTVTLGLCTETDSAFSMPRLLGIATETDSSFSVTISKSFTLGQAIGLGFPVEADETFALTPGTKTFTFGLCTETDSAFSLASIEKAYVFGQPVEVSGGLPNEADSAFTITPITKAFTFGLTTETDSSFACGITKPVPLGLANESDVSFTVGRAKTFVFGIAIEEDESFSLTTSGATTFAGLNFATETDSGLALTGSKTVTLGLATEDDQSAAALFIKAHTFTQATETNSGLAISLALVHSLGIAEETDTALGLVFTAPATEPFRKTYKIDARRTYKIDARRTYRR